MVGFGVPQAEVGVFAAECDVVFSGVVPQALHFRFCQSVFAAEYYLYTGLGHHLFQTSFFRFYRFAVEIADAVPAGITKINGQGNKIPLISGQNAAAGLSVGHLDRKRLGIPYGFPQFCLLKGKDKGIEFFHVSEHFRRRTRQKRFFRLEIYLILIHMGHDLFSFYTVFP